MNKRERFLAAIQNQIPDRVPVTPDISNYIPCKRTGLPFWDIYFYEKIPLWKAYLNAADHFGIDPWIGSCTGAPFLTDDRVERKSQVVARDEDTMIQVVTVRTPDGDMTEENTCFRYDPPTATKKLIKNFEKDWPKMRWLLRPPADINRLQMQEMREECNKRNAAFGVCFSYPGFQEWQWFVDGGVESLSYAMMDCPEILNEWLELDLHRGTRAMELILSTRPDYILFGGSGTITLSSPSLAQQYAIPALKKFSKMASDAGVATLLHSCGKSRQLVDMLTDETSVGCINPLEMPPMGDVILSEVKAARGRQIALMGNLHTTEVMLRGSADLVKRKSLEAMRDAGRGGGFVLSTGDQCGRETPDANLFALVEAAETYGRYDSDGNLPDVEEALKGS